MKVSLVIKFGETPGRKKRSKSQPSELPKQKKTRGRPKKAVEGSLTADVDSEVNVEPKRMSTRNRKK